MHAWTSVYPKKTTARWEGKEFNSPGELKSAATKISSPQEVVCFVTTEGQDIVGLCKCQNVPPFFEKGAEMYAYIPSLYNGRRWKCRGL
jgi:hypothetical protein